MDFDLLSHTTSVVVAHQQGPGRVSSEKALLKLICDVGGTLLGCKPGASEAASVAASPASSGGSRHKPVPTGDTLRCFECGMQLKMLKRHLLTVHGMTPEGYCRRHGLVVADTPMVTSGYTELRSQIAKESGLGKRPRTQRTS